MPRMLTLLVLKTAFISRRLADAASQDQVFAFAFLFAFLQCVFMCVVCLLILTWFWFGFSLIYLFVCLFSLGRFPLQSQRSWHNSLYIPGCLVYISCVYGLFACFDLVCFLFVVFVCLFFVFYSFETGFPVQS